MVQEWSKKMYYPGQAFGWQLTPCKLVLWIEMISVKFVMQTIKLPNYPLRVPLIGSVLGSSASCMPHRIYIYIPRFMHVRTYHATIPFWKSVNLKFACLMHRFDACLGDGRFGLALLGVGSGFGALWTLWKCMLSDSGVCIYFPQIQDGFAMKEFFIPRTRYYDWASAAEDLQKQSRSSSWSVYGSR